MPQEIWQARVQSRDGCCVTLVTHHDLDRALGFVDHMANAMAGGTITMRRKPRWYWPFGRWIDAGSPIEHSPGAGFGDRADQ